MLLPHLRLIFTIHAAGVPEVLPAAAVHAPPLEREGMYLLDTISS